MNITPPNPWTPLEPASPTGKFYEEGPLWTPEQVLPADCQRVKAFYAPRDGIRTMESAVCIEGRWWSFYHQDETPIAWRHMLDHRMSIG